MHKLLFQNILEYFRTIDYYFTCPLEPDQVGNTFHTFTYIPKMLNLNCRDYDCRDFEWRDFENLHSTEYEFYRVLSIATKEVHLLGVSLISSERIWPGFSAQLAREAGRPNIDVDFRVLAFQC